MRKTLILVRHATTEFYSRNGDFDRRLTPGGEAEAAKTAAQITSLLDADLLKPNGLFIYSSPAVRAMQTAKIFASVIGFAENSIISDRRIYMGDPRTMIEILKETTEATETMFLFGHNPGITSLAHVLCKETFMRPMPPCGAVGLTPGTYAWNNLAPSLAKKLFYVHPDASAS